jgi:hypothetical protein
MAVSGNGSDRVLTHDEASSEFDGILAWAVGQVAGEDPDEMRRAALKRMRQSGDGRRRLRRSWDEASEEGAKTDDEHDETGTDSGEEHGGEQERSDHEGEEEQEEIKDPTWSEIKLGPVMRGLADGTYQRLQPTIGLRADGMALFYLGCVNALHGESGDGKSFAALFICAQEIALRHHAFYIDMEDHADGFAERLMDLGADPDVVDMYFHYFNPAEPYGKAARKRLLGQIRQSDATVVVIDSTGESMGLEDGDANVDEDYQAWVRLLPRPMADLGPAVVCLDQPPKARNKPKEERLFASGTQRKRAMITGAGYVIETAKGQEMGKGHIGAAELVCSKDKRGNYRTSDVVATFVLDATVSPYRVELEVPEPLLRPEGGGFRPTKKMEQISRYVEANPDLPKGEVETAIRGDTKTTRLSFALLITEGYFAQPGPGKAHLLRSLKPYRADDDPKAGVSQGVHTTHGADDDLDDEEG